jgi:cation diffusion facilitator family transporter
MISPPTANQRQQAAARLSLASNIFLVIIKVIAGFASGSISVLAEGVQSSMDVIASALILVTVRVAAAPPDRSHPYGHGKFENIASLAQLGLILSTAVYLLYEAWTRWKHPVTPHLGWGAAAMLTALVVNTIVSGRLFKVARETVSPALQAEALHLRGDLLSCLGVLVGLVAVKLTNQPRLDPIIAAVMTLVMVVAALRLLRDALRPLVDERLPPEEEAKIVAVLEADERVLGYHRLRTRSAGAHQLMDIHILLDDHLTFSAAHAISEEVEDAVRRALPNADVIVHAEPFHEETQHQMEEH